MVFVGLSSYKGMDLNMNKYNYKTALVEAKQFKKDLISIFKSKFFEITPSRVDGIISGFSRNHHYDKVFGEELSNLAATIEHINYIISRLEVLIEMCEKKIK
jgi:hypothetical protein